MTDATGLPAARPRKILTQIAPVTWEHPADRAALQTLRSVPGFDEVVKKIVGFFGERGIRLLFQANAVRVGRTQFPRLNALYTDVLTSLDWPERPELFVSQTPFVNAGAYGMDHPFIVINSGALKLLDDDEMRTLLGHELGHVMSGHALYHTLLVLLLNVSLAALPFLAGIAILPIQLALLEWFRKSELSSDRAGLLACQDPSIRCCVSFADFRPQPHGDSVTSVTRCSPSCASHSNAINLPFAPIICSNSGTRKTCHNVSRSPSLTHGSDSRRSAMTACVTDGIFSDAPSLISCSIRPAIA